MGNPYSGRWAFSAKDNSNLDMYPPGQELLIGQDESGKFLMAWTDKEGHVHVLSGLGEADGAMLRAAQATVVSDGGQVNVTLSTAFQSAGGVRTILGSVEAGSGIGEGNLTGNWGAEGPPRPLPWLARLLIRLANLFR